MVVETQDLLSARIDANRERQRELYGAPLGDRVRRLTATLGVSQARLARALGLSPAMLSQLVSGRRVKIGDPAVLSRMLLLDQRGAAAAGSGDARAVEALLEEVAGVRWQWRGQRPAAQRPPVQQPPVQRPSSAAAESLRSVTDPARLAAAAALLGPAFPEIAEVLRLAAGRRAR
jgi:transcriptional regulator with XRE-family HTH domain